MIEEQQQSILAYEPSNTYRDLINIFGEKGVKIDPTVNQIAQDIKNSIDSKSSMIGIFMAFHGGGSKKGKHRILGIRKNANDTSQIYDISEEIKKARGGSNIPLFMNLTSCNSGSAKFNAPKYGQNTVFLTYIGRNYIEWPQFTIQQTKPLLQSIAQGAQQLDLIEWIYLCVAKGIAFNITMVDDKGKMVIFNDSNNPIAGIESIRGKPTAEELYFLSQNMSAENFQQHVSAKFTNILKLLKQNAPNEWQKYSPVHKNMSYQEIQDKFNQRTKNLTQEQSEDYFFRNYITILLKDDDDFDITSKEIKKLIKKSGIIRKLPVPNYPPFIKMQEILKKKYMNNIDFTLKKNQDKLEFIAQSGLLLTLLNSAPEFGPFLMSDKISLSEFSNIDVSKIQQGIMYSPELFQKFVSPRLNTLTKEQVFRLPVIEHLAAAKFFEAHQDLYEKLLNKYLDKIPLGEESYALSYMDNDLPITLLLLELYGSAKKSYDELVTATKGLNVLKDKVKTFGKAPKEIILLAKNNPDAFKLLCKMILYIKTQEIETIIQNQNIEAALVGMAHGVFAKKLGLTIGRVLFGNNARLGDVKLITNQLETTILPKIITSQTINNWVQLFDKDLTAVVGQHVTKGWVSKIRPNKSLAQIYYDNATDYTKIGYISGGIRINATKLLNANVTITYKLQELLTGKTVNQLAQHTLG